MSTNPAALVAKRFTHKKLLLAALTLLPASGCMSVPNLARELAKDPATVSITVNTIYGTLRFVRTVALTNQSVTVDPITGVITIKP